MKMNCICSILFKVKVMMDGSFLADTVIYLLVNFVIQKYTKLQFLRAIFQKVLLFVGDIFDNFVTWVRHAINMYNCT